MIFFDIDGTLIDHASASAEASRRLFDLFPGQIPFAREQFPAAWEEILNKHFDRFCRGEISLWEQRRARLREAFGAPAMSDYEVDSRYNTFIGEYEQLTRAYDDAAECLESLAGQPFGVISNGARDQQIGKLRRAGLLKYFSVFVFSDDVGRGKPHPSIFLEACRRAGKSPVECVHIGDDLIADVEASLSLGMTSIWLDRLQSAERPVSATRITTLRDLCSSAFPVPCVVDDFERTNNAP